MSEAVAPVCTGLLVGACHSLESTCGELEVMLKEKRQCIPAVGGNKQTMVWLEFSESQTPA